MNAEAVVSRSEVVPLGSRLKRTFAALLARVLVARTPRQLKVMEAAPLGEKRYVAVVQFEQRRFLVGSAPSSLVMLASLDDGTAFMPELWDTVERAHA